MAVALKWIVAFCCIVSLSGCFHSRPDIHTIARNSHRSASQQHTSYASKSYHTVRKGDSLYKIGQQFNVPFRALAKRNQLHYPYTIYVGQKIYLSTSSQPQTSPKTPPSKHHNTQKRHSPTTQRQSAKKSSIHLRWPVRGPISSPFGRRGSRMHDGIDIAVKDGTPVHAAAAGIVVHSDARLSGYGKLIIIRHSSQLFTAYAHNQRLLVNVGDHIKAGQIISKSGHSGHAIGPHLHFEVRIGTDAVNPLDYLPRRPAFPLKHPRR